jgi:membrane protease YdiL (CAAX protease family)
VEFIVDGKVINKKILYRRKIMEETKVKKPFWRYFFLGISALVVPVIIVSIGLFVYSIIHIFTTQDLTFNAFNDSTFLNIGNIIQNALLIISVGLLMRYMRKKGAYEKQQVNIKMILVAILLGIFLGTATDLTYLFQSASESADNYISTLTGTNIFLVLADTVIFAAIAEELIFRGLIFNVLKIRLPLWASILISALLFGLAHATGGIMYILTTAIMGVILCLIQHKYKSLIPGMIIHGINNLIATLCAIYEVELGLTFDIIAQLVSIVVVVITFILIFKKKEK